MRLYGVHCKCSHIDLKCQESRAYVHTSHIPLTCLPLVAVMAVFCCVVLRDVALAEAARTSSRKKVVHLPTAVTCSISLFLLHVYPNSVSVREVSAFYRAPPHSTALCTSREGVRSASTPWSSPLHPGPCCNTPVVEAEIHCVEVL